MQCFTIWATVCKTNTITSYLLLIFSLLKNENPLSRSSMSSVFLEVCLVLYVGNARLWCTNFRLCAVNICTDILSASQHRCSTLRSKACSPQSPFGELMQYDSSASVVLTHKEVWCCQLFFFCCYFKVVETPVVLPIKLSSSQLSCNRWNPLLTVQHIFGEWCNLKCVLGDSHHYQMNTFHDIHVCALPLNRF